MKKYMYFGMFILLTLISCSKNENSGMLPLDDKVSCTPYVNVSVNSSEFSSYPIDESTIIVGHRQEGNCLILDTRFSGGCVEHEMLLLIDENNQLSINANTEFYGILSHDNTDDCEAYIALEVLVDISKIELLERDIIRLSIENYNQIVELVF